MPRGDWIDWLSGIAIDWGAALVMTSIKATVVLVLAVLVLRSARRASASFRHLVWFVAITSPVALTLLPYVLPQWRTPIPIPSMVDWFSGSVVASVVGQHTATETTAGDLLSGSLARPVQSETQLAHHAALNDVAQLHANASAIPKRSTHVWFLILWSVGVGSLAAQLLVAHLRLRTRCRGTKTIDDPGWNQTVEECTQRCGVSRRVSLTFSETQSMPMVCGILTPTIVLPPEAATWSAERRRVVLQHEFAHVARRDCLTSLIARSICILHWFNPFLWGALRMMNKERERACDDLVLNAGVRASSYAEHVLSIAGRFGSRNSTGAGLAMARPSQLEGRLLAVLNASRSRRRITHRAGFCTVGLALLMLAPIAAITTATALTDPTQTRDTGFETWSELAGEFGDDRDWEHWTSDTLLAALRSYDNTLRRRAETDIRSMGSDHPVVDGVVDRLLVDLGSENSRLRQQSAWELEKTRSPRVVEPLVELLGDDDPDVRAAAAGALGATEDPRAIAPLRNLSTDGDARVREWSARALGNFREPRATESLLEYLQDDSPDVREWAARGLSDFDEPEVFEALADALTDSSASVREWAARSLGDSSDPLAAEALIGALGDSSRDVREWAARSLGNIGSPDAVAALSETLRDDHANVREWAARALGNIGDPAAAESLAGALSDDDADVRTFAARALGYVGDARDVDSLAEALWDENADVRQFAAQALGHIADPAAVGALGAALADEDGDVRESAMRALGRIASPEAVRLIEMNLQGDDAELRQAAREAIESIELRRDPDGFFLRKYPDEDAWLRLARTYVAKHAIQRKEALKLAREAIKKRDTFVKDHKNADQDRVDRWIDTLKNDYLIAGLERMVERSSARRGARKPRR